MSDVTHFPICSIGDEVVYLDMYGVSQGVAKVTDFAEYKKEKHVILCKTDGRYCMGQVCFCLNTDGDLSCYIRSTSWHESMDELLGYWHTTEEIEVL